MQHKHKSDNVKVGVCLYLDARCVLKVVARSKDMMLCVTWSGDC